MKCNFLYKSLTVLVLSFSLQAANAESFVNIKGDSVALDNGVVGRVVKFDDGRLFTSQLFLGTPDNSYIEPDCKEFSFLLNDKYYSGKNNWTLNGIEPISDAKGGQGAQFKLAIKDDNCNLELAVNYLLYPESPVVRKWISFTNKGKDALKLEALNTEEFIIPMHFVYSMVYCNYGRMKHISRFVGNWDDPVVVVHHTRQSRGIALGNEAVGVLKRTAYHPEGEPYNTIQIGMTHAEQDFPFRKWINKEDSWTAPQTFIAPYEGYNDGFQAINNEVNEFVIKYMGTRITEIDHKPVFVYNTWFPFRFGVNDTLVADLADAAADCGIQEFVIDDGWQTNHVGVEAKYWYGDYGDWNVNTEKFKGGLKPTFDYIKSKGMKPGLWVSVGAVTSDADIFEEHPEWMIKNKEGKIANIHNDREGFYQASFATDWKDYIRDIIQGLVDDNGLAYAKLDLAVVTSPYVNDDTRSGSYGENKYSRDHQESFYVNYQRMLEMFDELHETAPELFIDCTYETAGKDQLMDYAIAKHAEGNWLSNFEIPGTLGALRIRQMSWWRSPAVPASSLVIGSFSMQDPEFMFGLKSLVGTLPIVLGDPRQIPAEKRKEIKAWSLWMQDMQETYDYMSYRKDVIGFGEPKEGAWDAWQRINFQTKEGGIVGVFKQDLPEKTRIVTLLDLDESKQYEVRLAPYGELVHTASGKDLMETGFTTSIEKQCDGNIYEVRMIK